MRLVIVDDSPKRIAQIRNLLDRYQFKSTLDFVVCESADAARRELIKPADLMVLDVLIPKKDGGTPQALHSVNLLADVCDPRKRYIRPRLIVGITADLAELGVYREQFAKQATVVLEGDSASLDWTENLMLQISSLIETERKLIQQNKDAVLISIHGIRTYGHWQSKLSEEVTQYSRSFESVEIKYGFFDIFSFVIPMLRNRSVRKVSRRLVTKLETVKEKEIYLVAHSFGTLILSTALKSWSARQKIKGVILCGSPLAHDTNIDHIISASEMTVNDCGTRDFVLIAARMLLLGLGDAGRVGFNTENSPNFRNRYFSGGHSLYFREYCDRGQFYDAFWLKFIALGSAPEPFDSRESFVGHDIVDVVVKIGTVMKPLLYLAVGLGLVSFSLARAKLMF